jgi:hypothetical protein
MSSSALPPLRAAVIDARAAGSAEPRPALLRALSGRGVGGAPSTMSVLVESDRYELLVEHLTPRTGTRERLEHLRGVDVAIVVAGQATAVASRDLKLLQACGCRRAIVVVPDEGARDLVENLARHLLLGARFDADEMPIVALPSELDRLDDREVRDVLAAVDACAIPRSPGAWVVNATMTAGRAVGAVLWGVVDDGDAWVSDGTRPLAPARVRFARRSRAGERVEVEIDGVDVSGDVVLSSAPLHATTRVVSPDLERAWSSPEMCFVFGGNGGWVDARLERPRRVHLARFVFPVDDVVGVIRFQGAGLGPVQILRLDGDEPPQAR